MPDFAIVTHVISVLFLLFVPFSLYVAFAMDTDQLGNDLRILADETGSEIWCCVSGKFQNLPCLPMFLSSSRRLSGLVSGNPRI